MEFKSFPGGFVEIFGIDQVPPDGEILAYQSSGPDNRFHDGIPSAVDLLQRADDFVPRDMSCSRDHLKNCSGRRKAKCVKPWSTRPACRI